MISSSRAGLLFLLTLLLLANLVVPAPIPRDQSVTPIARRQPSDANLSRREPELRSAAAGSLLARRQLSAPITQGSEVLKRRGIKDFFRKIGNAFKKAGQAIKKGFQKAGQAIKKGFQKVGQGIKHVAQKIGNGIKNAAKKIGNGIKHVAQKIGNGIKTAAKKVGKFIKEKGAAIAKFGLKLYSTAVGIAGKVAGFIPGVGKVVGKALGAWSKVTSFAADKIHAKLPGKLDKGFKVLDKIQHPFSGTAGKVFEALT